MLTQNDIAAVIRALSILDTMHVTILAEVSGVALTMPVMAEMFEHGILERRGCPDGHVTLGRRGRIIRDAVALRRSEWEVISLTPVTEVAK